MKKKNMAIFASGSGTNAGQIMKYFQHNPQTDVSLVLSNNPAAYVLERAKNFGVETFVFSRKSLNDTTLVDAKLEEKNIDFIVLAGFMLLMPSRIVTKYHQKIVNIHPALLPKYGGKGMYGMFVHEAVVNDKEKETGITIHWVDERYDEGQIIFQARCRVDPKDTAEDVANKVHQLEYLHYPRVIDGLLHEKQPLK